MPIKNDYSIVATYPTGNEFVVYDELTYDEATDLLVDMNTTKTEDVMYIIADGTGNIPKLTEGSN